MVLLQLGTGQTLLAKAVAGAHSGLGAGPIWSCCSQALAKTLLAIVMANEHGVVRANWGPKAFQSRSPCGILSVGPLGTGKTWLAKAVAGVHGIALIKGGQGGCEAGRLMVLLLLDTGKGLLAKVVAGVPGGA